MKVSTKAKVRDNMMEYQMVMKSATTMESL